MFWLLCSVSSTLSKVTSHWPTTLHLKKLTCSQFLKLCWWLFLQPRFSDSTRWFCILHLVVVHQSVFCKGGENFALKSQNKDSYPFTFISFVFHSPETTRKRKVQTPFCSFTPLSYFVLRFFLHQMKKFVLFFSLLLSMFHTSKFHIQSINYTSTLVPKTR